MRPQPIADSLERWRRAVRVLESTLPGSPELERAELEVAARRDEYHRLAVAHAVETCLELRTFPPTDAEFQTAVRRATYDSWRGRARGRAWASSSGSLARQVAFRLRHRYPEAFITRHDGLDNRGRSVWDVYKEGLVL